MYRAKRALSCLYKINLFDSMLQVSRANSACPPLRRG
jgi:hypothetical protein